MKKIKKLFLVFALVFVSTFAFLRANVYHVKAYDSIDSTGATTWNIKSEEVKNKYGVNYSYVIGKPTTQGATGTEKIVNYFSMKPDGVNSKLVTWGVQDGNSGFKTNQLTEIAKDYEKKHPGWIVVSGINADQWYYKTTKNNQKGGYFFCDNPYYPFTMDGQNLFTINPLGGRGNGIAITNNPNSPFISVTNSDRIELQVYDANDQLIATFPVSGYNQNPGASGTTVWSGYVNPETMGKAFINREVNTTNSLFVIENADLAYMNNTRDYAYEGSMYAPVDSFYGKGTISSTVNQISLGAGQFAIETTSEEVKAKLAVGVKVIIEQQYSNEGANEVESVTGFHTVQVKDGVYQDSSAPYNLASKPRSIFGVKEDGTYFLLTTRDNKIGSTGGTAHTETQAILSYYGAYTAYQDDGGGSSTAIYRTDSGTFDVVSGSCDSATTLKSQRLVFSGLFFVVKDPGVSIKETTPSSVTLRLNNTQYANSLEDVKAKVNGKTYEMTNGIIKIDDLEENTEYEINIEYKLNDQNLTALTYAKTAEYKPGIKLNPTSDGFIVDIPKVDSELITSKITFLIDDKTIVVDNSAGELESYQITGLYKDMDYEISYTYEVKNIKTNTAYSRSVSKQIYTTLNYDVPVIESFTVKTVGNKVKVRYEITDIDSVIIKLCLIHNDEKIELEIGSREYTFDDIDVKTSVHKFKLVATYETLDGENRYDVESNELTLGEEHVHEWVEATCTAPKTCKTCGATEGEALGHDWKDATTEAPKTCTRCGTTEGEKLPTEKPKKNCKKTSLISILVSLTVLAGCLVIRKKH